MSRFGLASLVHSDVSFYNEFYKWYNGFKKMYPDISFQSKNKTKTFHYTLKHEKWALSKVTWTK